MRTTVCVITNCEYLTKGKGGGSYRCNHPDAGKDKKTRKEIKGKKVYGLTKCPRGYDEIC